MSHARSTDRSGERLEECLIIGCNGGFGRIFTHKLREAGLVVRGIDRQQRPLEPESLASYVRSSLPETSGEADAQISATRCLLLCVPEHVVVASLPRLLDTVREGALIIDIASVKSRIARALEPRRDKVAYLSIHPMFAPAADFDGRHLVIIDLGLANGLRDHFRELLSGWKSRTSEMSAEEHDRATAYVQAGTHAAVLAFATMFARGAVSVAQLEKLSTSVSRSLLSMAARMVGTNDPDLYWSIQHENPFASDAREQLAEQATAFAREIGG
ncbi:MAG: prephenate dehydrogenase, partial [Acidobacteriota bacterium]